MLKINVNSGNTFQLEEEKGRFILEGNPVEWDIVKTGTNKFHIIKDNKSYNAEFIKADPETKTFDIKVNNKIHQVKVSDQMDLLLEKLGMGGAGVKKINEIKAPMPGLIVDIKVAPGQEVKKGDALLVLEAMKMENILKSPGDGVIKAIKVEKRQSVEKNQVMIIFN